MIDKLKELIEFEYGDCNCDSEKKCSYCRIMDELNEWREAARSEAEEVNKLQSEVKRRKEQYDKVRKILITWIRWQEREIYKNPQLGNIRIQNIIRQARESLK
jgi:hypothetical protein